MGAERLVFPIPLAIGNRGAGMKWSDELPVMLPVASDEQKALPTAAMSIATMATRPIPQRFVARVAMTAPMNDENPPTPATRPRRRTSLSMPW